MARRYINTAQFNPYSFQEMWEPALAATQAHQQQMGAMAELNAKSNLIGQYINPEKDPEEYAAWQQYNSNIQQASQDLMTRGLSTAVFNNVYGLTSDYQSNIKPIEISVENQQKFANLQMEAKMKNPKLFFALNASDYALKDFKHGLPQMAMVDGEDAQKQAAAMATAYANGHMEMLSPQAYSKFKMLVETAVTDGHGNRLSFEDAFAQLRNSNPNSVMGLMKQAIMETCGGNSLRDNGKLDDYAKLGSLIDNALISGIMVKPDLKLEDNGYETQQRLNIAWAGHALEREKFEYSKAKDLLALEQASQQNMNTLSWRQSYSSNGTRNGQIPYFAPSGDSAKAYANAVLNRMQGAASSGKGKKGKYEINFTDKNGKHLEISKDFGNKVNSFTIAFPGQIDGRASNKFEFRIDGKTYYCEPEDLGLSHSVVETMNAWNKDPLVQKWLTTPSYLSSEEAKTISNTQAKYVTLIMRELNDLAKYTSQKEFEKLQ